MTIKHTPGPLKAKPAVRYIHHAGELRLQVVPLRLFAVELKQRLR